MNTGAASPVRILLLCGIISSWHAFPQPCFSSQAQPFQCGGASAQIETSGNSPRFGMLPNDDTYVDARTNGDQSECGFIVSDFSKDNNGQSLIEQIEFDFQTDVAREARKNIVMSFYLQTDPNSYKITVVNHPITDFPLFSDEGPPGRTLAVMDAQRIYKGPGVANLKKVAVKVSAGRVKVRCGQLVLITTNTGADVVDSIVTTTLSCEDALKP